MKTKNVLLTFAILFIALISGCAKDDFVEIDGLCPEVLSTTPLNAATNVPLDQLITATFNEEMNPETINQSSFTLNGTSQIAGVIAYSGKTATFKPSALLSPNTTYTATIKRTVKDLTGNALQTEKIWTFSTGLTVTPMVASTDPTNNENNVVLNKLVSVTFNMPMKASTITGTTYTLKQGTTAVAGTVTYSGTTAVFTPTVALAANTVYTATVSAAVTNLDNTRLPSDYVWKFTTGTIIAPTVTSTDPINNATGVALNKTITANFSMVMDPLTINATNFTLKQGTTAITGVVTYSGTTASFKPTNALVEGKTYTATITTAAKNAAGVPLANNYVWNFTTLSATVVPAPSGLFFGVFGGNAGITNQGLNTRVNGPIGTTAASSLVTGFTDTMASPFEVYTITPLNNGLVNGGVFADAPAPGNATKAQKALEGLNAARDLYNSISPANKPGGSDQGSGELGALTLAPGVYKSASGTYKITNGDLTLDAQGNENATWYFQSASSLTVGSPAASRSVKLINGAKANNVYWYVGSQAVINYAGGGVMVGNVIANNGVTLSAPANSTTLPGAETVLNGRAISLVSSVTMVNTIINVPAN
ncbi:Ig-like domain-containing protein [Flavobacterium sp. ACAM 123]|uniref:Ig-like domain-containing protein n=1 Tax=Flavobacterium sp. ACAM 123 TaxID=1189620 RepID=UPI0003799029|nr:Ig-like domain-containing protein [Flavobacterium sp. ACAM 123]